MWQVLQFLQGERSGSVLTRPGLPPLRRTRGQHAWFAPTYHVAKISFKAAVAKMRPAIDAGWLTAVSHPTPCITGKGPLEGREWLFLTAVNKDLIYGQQWQSIVVEEFTRLKPGVIDAIRTTQIPEAAPMRMIGNLRDKANDGYRFARDVEAGHVHGWQYLALSCWDAVDAGVIDRSIIENARNDLTRRGMSHIFARDYENRFSDAGHPYPSDLLARVVQARTPRGPAVIMLDAGGTENPAGIVVARVWTEDRAIHVHIEHARHFVGLLTDLEQHVQALVQQYQPAAITFDSYAPMFGQVIASRYPAAACRVSSRAEVLSTNHGTIRAMMDGGTFTIDPGCRDLIDDLDQVTMAEEGVAFGYYSKYFDETGREHSVHADCANALLQGFGAAMAKAVPRETGPTHAHGTTHRPLGHRPHTQTRGRDWR